MLDNLAQDLEQHQQYFERTCIQFGLQNGDDAGVPMDQIVRVMFEHHLAWHRFTYKLAQFGEEVVMQDEKGNTLARYSVHDAVVVVEKYLHGIYHHLAQLALGCYRLGCASSNGIDLAQDLQQATRDIQMSREELDKHWQQIRRQALNG